MSVPWEEAKTAEDISVRNEWWLSRMVMPELMRQRHELLKAGYTPCRVVLPKCFDPGPYTGDDAQPEQPATIIGLPVTFVGTKIAVVAYEENS